MPQFVGSKWRKTVALLSNPSLRRIIPATFRFSKQRLKEMLLGYGMVYVKPDIGMHGKGVIRVERMNGRYRFRAGLLDRSFSSYDGMCDALLKRIKGRKYLIQRGVHLLKYKNRRFDLRVMVQKNPRNIWETTGMIGRVAAAHKIVTNYHDGGTLMPIESLLSTHLMKGGVREKVRLLKYVGVKVGKAMQRKFPRVCEIGIDVGMDPSLTPWILEVNTSPDPYIFRKHPDPSLFKKIRHYAIAYGKR